MRNHPRQWETIQKAVKQKRIPQAMLFVGPMPFDLIEVAVRLSTLLLCQKRTGEACGSCPDCLMVGRQEHPDMEWVKPDKKNGPIKIDQIRQLQQEAYLTPQRSRYKIILIEEADRMNTASANALLKILEEPAAHTIFILLAQQMSTLLPTIISRCQVFPYSAPYNASDLLTSANLQDSDKELVLQHAESILTGLIALREHKEHPCVLAASWTQFELNAFLWFSYLIFSQLLEAAFIPAKLKEHPQLTKLSSLLNPILICKQLDKIITLLKKLSHNMNVNHSLALEDLLLGL